jgi:hypothetical protein
VRFESWSGRGSCLDISMPEIGWRCNVGVARVPGDALIALPDEWALDVQPRRDPSAVDILELIGVDSPAHEAASVTIGTRRAHIELCFGALERPWRVVAERACPTHVGFPSEVVTFDGKEALLLRPEVAYRLARERRAGGSTHAR